MVDKEQIDAFMAEHVELDAGSKYSIDAQGKVNVNGSCTVKSSPGHMPVQFGTVSGNFNCTGSGMKSLEGGPVSVGGNFTADCLLINLEGDHLRNMIGGPRVISGSLSLLYNELDSLDGFPEKCGNGKDSSISIDFRENLGVLRLITNEVNVGTLNISHSPAGLSTLIQKYMGKPTPAARQSAAVACAAELIRAGFRGMAKL